MGIPSLWSVEFETDQESEVQPAVPTVAYLSNFEVSSSLTMISIEKMGVQVTQVINVLLTE